MIRSSLPVRVAFAILCTAGMGSWTWAAPGSPPASSSDASGSPTASPPASPLESAARPAGVWIYPAVKGYGGVRPRPDRPSDLSANVDYKVIVDVVHGDQDPAKVLGSLVRLARLVNLMAYAGIPRDHVHIAAVLEGMAGYSVLTNEAYRKLFKVDNPNLALLHELRESGVELMVCAQALAEHDWADSDVAPDVQVTLSALTDFVVYGQRGYSFMQL